MSTTVGLKMLFFERGRWKSRERENKERQSPPTEGMKVSVLCSCLGAFVRKRERARRRVVAGLSGELGSAAQLSESGLSEKEFEVEDLRSPLRLHPCSQISC